MDEFTHPFGAPGSVQREAYESRNGFVGAQSVTKERRFNESSLCIKPFYRGGIGVKVGVNKDSTNNQNPVKTSIKFVEATMADKGGLKDTTHEEILRQLATPKKKKEEEDNS
jgi:hypothetical protein